MFNMLLLALKHLKLLSCYKVECIGNHFVLIKNILKYGTPFCLFVFSTCIKTFIPEHKVQMHSLFCKVSS